MRAHLVCGLACIGLLMLHAPICAGLQSNADESDKVMPLETVDHLDVSSLLALQAAAGGGIFKQVDDELHLIMHKAEDKTAVMPDPRKPELGIQMVPHQEMASAFPAFAVMLANLTGEPVAANDTVNAASFQVISLMLHDLVDIADGQLTYKVSVIDSDLGRGSPVVKTPAAVEPASGLVIENLATKPTETYSKALSEFLSGPPRSIPSGHIKEASLLIDLVKPEDTEHQHMCLKNMAESGDLSYNIHKYLANPEQEVKAQGVMTIGWMLPFSLWAWVCCPTFFILTPWAVPLWVFCCI